MPRVSKQNKGQIGRTLMKAVDQANHAYKPKTVDVPRFIQQENNVAEQKMGKDLSSCIDQDNLTDFLQVVGMQNKNFEALRGMKLKNDITNREVVIDGNRDQEAILDQAFNVENNALLKNVRIPRKPKWTKEMTKEELNHLENLAFVEWRKSLAKIEETNYTIHITPYEKNIEVWKQLWRVIERSDIVVQIVDGRDPLFYRCADVEAYSKEVNPDKLNFLLINKSDLLSDEVRAEWSTYLNENKIDHMFFSALLEQDKINQEKIEDAAINKMLPSDLGLMGETVEQEEHLLNTPKIASREILLRTLRRLIEEVKAKKVEHKKQKELASHGHEELEDEMMLAELEEATKGAANIKQKRAMQVGMVGYPNVGKSSVINTLSNKKLVGVGSLPGKTKNYQTHFLSSDLILCDCPGLVFPNAASTRAEMVCNGVMPIDKLRDYLAPLDLMCSRVPKVVLEQIYKVKIDVEVPDGAYFLSKYAIQKGYYTGSAQPDLAKSAKLVLKEFVSGKLLFTKLPPTVGENSGIWQSNKIELHHADNILDNVTGDKVYEEEEKAENMEALHVNEEEKRLDQMLLKQETDKIGEKICFDDDDVVMLLVGKKVNGIKLNKQQKRDIKHAYQRGDKIDLNKYLDPNQIIEYTVLNKNKGLPTIA